MWYFAYGSNLNSKAVSEWCRHYGHRAPAMKHGRPVILSNYRLCFPIYSDYWGGGIGDIEWDPGKYVAGVLFSMTEAEMSVLDLKVGRKVDEMEKEIGIYRRIDVVVEPMGKGESIHAVTYTGTSGEKYHIPPTQHYMEQVVQGAYAYGISMMWISYLKSFSTQTGRKPRPPSVADVAPKM